MSQEPFSYRKTVIKNSPPGSMKDRLAMGGLGIAGEAGEVADELKKHLFNGKELDREKIILELGDVRWYMEHLMITLGTDIHEVEEKNAQKLAARFPDGYSDEAAGAKKDQK